MKLFRRPNFLWLFSIIVVSKSYAYDITHKFYIGGILAGAYQYQWEDGHDNKGRGNLPFQPEISFRPSAEDEIFAKLGFAAGNGLNDVTKFNLKPWIADLEDDVKNINGRNRDYLLTAWYKHTLKFSNRNILDLSGGIIDARDYIDENAYAKNEYTQVTEVFWRFMLNKYFAVTADVQYMKDKLDIPDMDDLEGIIGGI